MRTTAHFKVSERDRLYVFANTGCTERARYLAHRRLRHHKQMHQQPRGPHLLSARLGNRQAGYRHGQADELPRVTTIVMRPRKERRNGKLGILHWSRDRGIGHRPVEQQHGGTWSSAMKRRDKARGSWTTPKNCLKSLCGTSRARDMALHTDQGLLTNQQLRDGLYELLQFA